MTTKILHGDCLDILSTLDADSIDACVTDPPYGLSFMGRQWDHGVPGVPFWQEIYRVLKPGAHLVAMGGTRTYHRMTCAIEDAGFEIRDSLMWVYGTGFPKSNNTSIAIDKHQLGEMFDPETYIGPVTEEAKKWQGFGTALKPAFEPIVIARKPLSEKTVAVNVLRWGTGALNIAACRVDAEERPLREHTGRSGNVFGAGLEGSRAVGTTTQGRWPANVVHDGSDEVVGAFPNSAGQLAPISTKPSTKTRNVYGKMNREGEESANRRYIERGSTNFAPLPGQRRKPVSSAARFFYSAKASKADRAGSKHPTIKPISLMQWLARLITPPGGTVLDPFAGSGTTGAACNREGFNSVLIEREAEYISDIKRRNLETAE